MLKEQPALPSSSPFLTPGEVRSDYHEAPTPTPSPHHGDHHAGHDHDHDAGHADADADADDRQCRICLGEGGRDLIAPCRCRGSAKFVHRECLDSWRATSERHMTHCNECQYQYRLASVVADPDAEERRLRAYYASMTRDICLVVLAVETIVLSISLLMSWWDQEGKLVESRSFVLYHVYGFLMFLGLIGYIAVIWAVYTGGSGGGSGCVWINCNCDNDNKVMAWIVLIIVVILIVLGAIIGMFFLAEFISTRSKLHRERLWRYQEAKKYVVEDFNGREAQLEV